MKKALFAGSFDPFTKGHYEVVKAILPLFDEVTIAIAVNNSKKYLFTLQQRIDWIKAAFAYNPAIKVDSYDGLTLDYCKMNNITYLVRGIRTSTDFEYEKSIAQANQAISQELQTIFVPCSPDTAFISSTIIRELLVNNGNIQAFLPPNVTINQQDIR